MELDELLVDIRAAKQRPEYRRKQLAGLNVEGGIASIRVLRVVERTNDPDPTIGDVAAQMGVEPSTASRLVDAAVRRGHLTRTMCDEDRRRTRLQLTGDGRRLLAKSSKRRRELLSLVASDLTSDQVETLVDLLGILHAGYVRLENDG